MTLVVCWPQDQFISCAADSRISTGDGATLTDSGAKIFVVPIRVSKTNSNDPNLSKNHSLGFAFSGSTLVANNTHAIASTCVQILNKFSEEIEIPSVKSIANHYARVGEHVVKDLKSRFPNSDAFFEALIFGWCFTKQSLVTYHLSPNFEASRFEIRVSEYDATPGTALSIGSGARLFRSESERLIQSGAPSHPFNIFRKILSDEMLPDVGGFVQMGHAGKNGAELHPILMQDDENPDQVRSIIMGFDLSNAGSLDGY